MKKQNGNMLHSLGDCAETTADLCLIAGDESIRVNQVAVEVIDVTMNEHSKTFCDYLQARHNGN